MNKVRLQSGGEVQKVAKQCTEQGQEKQRCPAPNSLQCGLCDIMLCAQHIVENNTKFTGSHIQQ